MDAMKGIFTGKHVIVSQKFIFFFKCFFRTAILYKNFWLKKRTILEWFERYNQHEVLVFSFHTIYIFI